MTRKKYTKRKYADQVNRMMFTQPRCNIFASPGMGKTVMTITALETLNVVETDVYPILVIAPKRVANTVWSQEVDEWTHLHHLKVSKMTGTPAQREAALKAHADIYVINFDNIVWLHEMLDGKTWPFKTVVVDESTRFKNLRASTRVSPKGKKFLMFKGGSVRANALGRNAFKYVRHVNLSGTPAPQGLQDLWGQNWFIDFGASLGTSFETFKNRWFIYPRGADGFKSKLTPMPHAEREITRRIKPHSLTLDAYDWFPIEKPREIVEYIDMPAKTRKQYNTLLRQYAAEIKEDKTITAVNAAAKTMKLLQFASGMVLDEDKETHELHREKLDALESIFENQQGSPLLVVYHFKHDMRRILNKFKFAEVLSSNEKKQKEQEDAWNEGKIPMLLIHPASCGHGLSLQHGGHRMAFFTPWWDAELHDQVIERIGPTRQYQSGYKRAVDIYYILARKTVDETVLQVLKNKGVVQDAILEAVKWL